MLKKFLNGLIFGTGFGIAFVIICVVGMTYLLPKTFEMAQKEPEFKNPKTAEIAKPNSADLVVPQKEYSFFKNSENRMKIPENGGILSMSPISTPVGSKRPSTYQLWLTHSELWQIRTFEDNSEIEKLPYPDGASVKTLDSLMHKNLGIASRQSTMTISETEINNIKSSSESWRDDTLNGKLKITVEGVIFILPNPYET
jgi:hypothetical protein